MISLVAKSKVCPETHNIEESTQRYPFKSFGQALAFFNCCNPARYRSINLLEPDRFKRYQAPDFDGENSKDVWASVAHAIAWTIDGVHPYERFGWTLRNLGPREKQMAVEEIAEIQQLHPRKVYRYLKRMNNDLEAELIRRELLAPINDSRTGQD